ncbi:branched-chain amino acid transport system carrier protein [Halobacillus andaensis]|uniref:Branched-chain amino acid transport system carrier protein n=1 Tax=Halobacillus andaensis TaxID=1176239 RepID=A0A917B4G1_HALAA|nr:branched-chain amino acid transport system II carrier protein [Halobacillus andaensis]MBP2004501.1 LIVCS family branched-chain amino acid:cation transporter [Halobacillus andaensis]GGF21170.1 branched-chain amino acid transport system carrier protein [Halobacillus andaensis]
MQKKDIVFIGFMLFALFFGAGNLIYPVALGMEAGTSYWPAIIGFVLTGVGLPIITVAAISLVRNGAVELAGRVHPLFGLIFTSIIYLAIGPFFGIPRAANVGFETGIAPWIGGVSTLGLLIFTIIFFTLVFLTSLNPSKLVDRVGQFLTPALFLAIFGLVIGSFFLLNGDVQPAQDKYSSQPFSTGFIEGYLTMDAIASLAFGIIVVTSFRDRGLTNAREITFRTVQAGLVTAIGLTSVYISIGWIGVKMATEGEYANGSAVLAGAADLMYGNLGTLLLGIIVLLACFTTCVGLTVACGQFFSKRFKSLSYKSVISVITITSLLVSNLGLNEIIAYSVPVLVFLYPIAIVLVALTFIGKTFNHSPYVYRGAVLLTGLVSLYDGLAEFGFSMNFAEPIISSLPFYEFSLSWIFPAIIGGVIGWLIAYAKAPKPTHDFQN